VTELTGLLPLLADSPAWRALQSSLAQDAQRPELQVPGAARPFVLAALTKIWDGPLVYLTARVDRAWHVAEQLPVWLPQTPVQRFAEPVSHFYQRAPWGEEAIRNRITALAALGAAGDIAPPPVIICSARALMQRSMAAEQFRQETLTLRPGMRMAPDELLARCLRLGYSAASMAVTPGSFSRRGGLVDIFPQAARTPLRVDYFDDEIEQLRSFDPASQRSLARLTVAQITPARELLPQQAQALTPALRAWFDDLPADDGQGFLHGLHGITFGLHPVTGHRGCVLKAGCLSCGSLAVPRLGVTRGCDVADRIDTGEDVLRASTKSLEGGIDPGGPGHIEIARGIIEVVTGANRFDLGAVLMPSIASDS